MSDPTIFVSYDVEHDRELYEKLCAHSERAGCEIVGASERAGQDEAWGARARSTIGGADQMVVLCGEHTDSCESMGEELRFAREEGTPFVLLWGRREVMCTKPRGARSTEGMYRWTRGTLQEQIRSIVRRARSDEAAESLRGMRGKSPR